MYINFSSRDNGPQYETWEYGTFTGELFVGNNLVLFENYIDIDGDSVDDVSISLTVLGLLTLNEGFGFEPPFNPPKSVERSRYALVAANLPMEN